MQDKYPQTNKADYDSFFGYITPAVAWLTGCITSPFEFIFKPRVGNDGEQDILNTNKRAKRIEIFNLITFFFEITLFECFFREWINSFWAGIFIFLIGYRISFIVLYLLKVSLFDRKNIPQNVPHYVASVERLIVLAFVNYIELAICFSIIYVFGKDNLIGFDGWFSPIYFSFITQMTIGYGDIKPDGWIRFVVCIQGLSGIIILVLGVGNFVRLLPSVKSVADINRNDQQGGINKQTEADGKDP